MSKFMVRGFPAAATVALASSVGVLNMGSDLAFLMLPAVLLLTLIMHALYKGASSATGSCVLNAWALLVLANPLWSQWHTSSSWMVYILGALPAIGLLAARPLQHEQSWITLRRGVYFVGTMVAGWCVAEYFFIGGRSNGPLIDANAAAGFLNLLSFPVMLRLFEGELKSRTRIALTILLTLLVAGVFATFSRGGIGAMIIGFASVLLAALLLGPNRHLRALANVLIAAVLAYILIYFGPQQPVDRIVFAGATEDNSIVARLLMWRSSWELFLQQPLLGHGLGTFKMLYPGVRALSETSSSGDLAHNDYMQFLAEGGVPLAAALLAYTAWLVYIGRQQLNMARSEQAQYGAASTARLEAIGITIGLIAIAAHAAVNFIYYIACISVLGGLLLARLRAVAIPQNDLPNEISTNSSGRLLRSVRLPVTALMLSMLYMLTMDVYIQHHFDPKHDDTTNYDLRSPLYQQALALTYLQPINPLPRRFIAYAQANSALENPSSPIATELAINAMRDIRVFDRLKSVDCHMSYLKARLMRQYGNDIRHALKVDATASSVLNNAIIAQRTCLPAYLVLANVQLSSGKETAGIETLNQAVPWLVVPGIGSDAKWGSRLLASLSEAYQRVGERDQARAVARFLLQHDPSNSRARQVLRSTGSGVTTGASSQI